MAKAASEPKVNDYQDRVIAERNERTGEVERLDAFIAGEPFLLLDEKNQELLKRQSAIMHDLVAVLNARIVLFS